MADFNNMGNQFNGNQMGGIPNMMPQQQFATEYVYPYYQQQNPYIPGGYNNQMGYNGYNNGYYNIGQGITTPTFTNILNNDVIKKLMTNPNKNLFDMNITEDDLYKALCYHNDNKNIVVRRTKDGECYCPICQAKFSGKSYSDEKLKETTKIILDVLQQIKLTGQIPTAFGKDYFSIILMIQKIPELYKYCNRNIEKIADNNMYTDAYDISSNAIYNGINNRQYQPPMMGMFNQQPIMGTVPMGGYPMNNMANQPMVAGNVNPMQIPYGIDPNAANQQFANQANMMMGAFQQPQQPTGQQPMMGQQPIQQMNSAPQQPQPVQQQSIQQPQPVQQPQTVVTESGKLTL